MDIIKSLETQAAGCDQLLWKATFLAAADELRRLRAENERLLAALSGMVESFDILLDETPIGANPIAAGVVRGAFIGAISDARACLPNAQDQGRA
jgi:hypothetical protein